MAIVSPDAACVARVSIVTRDMVRVYHDMIKSPWTNRVLSHQYGNLTLDMVHVYLEVIRGSQDMVR
jgi:hypothetical protein